MKVKHLIAALEAEDPEAEVVRRSAHEYGKFISVRRVGRVFIESSAPGMFTDASDRERDRDVVAVIFDD